MKRYPHPFTWVRRHQEPSGSNVNGRVYARGRLNGRIPSRQLEPVLHGPVLPDVGDGHAEPSVCAGPARIPHLESPARDAFTAVPRCLGDLVINDQQTPNT